VRNAGTVLVTTFSAIVLLTVLLPFAYTVSRFSFVGVLFGEAILSAVYIGAVVGWVLRKRGRAETTIKSYVMLGYFFGLIGFVYVVYRASAASY
jgi:membrane-anchored glycerophosphoryl diester phosphodiesterase (GDPDase)